jgi:hypothetical protein
VVREVHKQYSETLNKTMLTLLGVALFCLLTTIGSPDKLLLAGDSTIKVPFADTPLSFLGFIVVAPLMTPKMPATLIQTVVVEGALCGYCTNRCRSSILGSISCNGRAVISTYMKNNQASPST